MREQQTNETAKIVYGWFGFWVEQPNGTWLWSTDYEAYAQSIVEGFREGDTPCAQDQI